MATWTLLVLLEITPIHCYAAHYLLRLLLCGIMLCLENGENRPPHQEALRRSKRFNPNSATCIWIIGMLLVLPALFCRKCNHRTVVSALVRRTFAARRWRDIHSHLHHSFLTLHPASFSTLDVKLDHPEFVHSLSELATHVNIEQPIRAETVVDQILQLRRSSRSQPVTDLSSRDLIELGAVWFLPENANRDKPSSGMKPLRLFDSDRILERGNYLRIHHDPRRFPKVYEYDWNKRIHGSDNCQELLEASSDGDRGVIVAENATLGWLVIDKPEQVPVHMTVDNCRENVAACLRAARSSSPKSFSMPYVSTPHRIDHNTSGLLVIATSKVFANYFSNLLQFKTHHQLKHGESNDLNTSNREAVHKLYRCLVCVKSPPFTDFSAVESWSVEGAVSSLQYLVDTGRVVRHYLEPSFRAPKRFVSSPPSLLDQDAPVWAECILRIRAIGQTCALVGNEPGRQLASNLWSTGDDRQPPPGVQAVVELEVELLTGRTHQIRGQLSAMGHPLVGDVQYFGGATTSSTNPLQLTGTNPATDRLALQCFELEFLDPDVSYEPDGAQKMTRSSRWNRFRLERAWWTTLVEQYQMSSRSLAIDQLTTSCSTISSPLAAGIQPSACGPSDGSNDSKKLLPLRVSLSPGRNKYVLIKATSEKDNLEDIWFVKSSSPTECGGPYHGNVAQDLREWISAAGYRATVTGGGRIHYQPDQNLAVVYGFSFGFGRGDHQHAASLIRGFGIQSIVDDNPDLY